MKIKVTWPAYFQPRNVLHPGIDLIPFRETRIVNGPKAKRGSRFQKPTGAGRRAKDE
jgi:hypothetical protein